MVAIALLFAGAVQLASASLIRDPGSHVGLAVYGALDRVAPSSSVEDVLANAALARGDTTLARHYAVRMPPGSRRDGTLAAIAAQRGELVLAYEYAYAAADSERLQADVMALARTQPAAAYDEERRVRARLATLGTQPDAVAEADWTLGALASWSGHPRRAMQQFEIALASAPLNEKYLLSAANQALSMRDNARAQALYRRCLSVDPASGNAFAGLGILAARRGDRATATAFLAKARAVQPDAGMIPVLVRALP